MQTNGAIPPIEERSIGELVATATRDLSLLIHKEFELAKTELAAEAKAAGLAAGLLGGAGFVGLFGAVLLSVAAAFGISALGVSLGYGFLCVAGVYLGLAGLLAGAGVVTIKRGRVGKPERTIRTLSDSISWARHPTVAPDRELEELRARHNE